MNNNQIVSRIRNLSYNEEENHEFVNELIRQNMTEDRIDAEGNTPLILCVKYGKVEAVQQLLHVADVWVDKPNYEGDTALIYAVKARRLQIFEDLLDADANIDKPNNQGKSAFDIIHELYGDDPDERFVELANLHHVVVQDQDHAIDHVIDHADEEKVPAQHDGRRVNLRRDHNNLGQPPKFKILSQYEYDAKNGVLFDPIDHGDRNNQEYLDEDDDNIIFILKEGEKYTCYGYPRSQIGADVDTDVFHDCKRRADGSYELTAYGDGKKYNRDERREEIIRFALVYSVFISKEELADALSTGERVFFLGEPVIQLLYTYSVGSNDNAVGAFHCQKGTDIKVHSIYVCKQET